MRNRTKNERSVQDFAHEVAEIKDLSSRNDKKDVIYDITEQSLWSQKIAILAGEEFDNIGIGPSTAQKAVMRAFDKMEPEVEQAVADKGSLTEAVMSFDIPFHSQSDRLDELYMDIQELESKSGSRQMKRFAQLIKNYTVPWLVVWAVLGDMKIGVTHNSICMGAAEPRGYSKDAIRRGRALIPDTSDFVNAVQNSRSIGSPQAGEPFAPMKAKSSNVQNEDDWLGQIKLDGYRCIIHVNHGEVEAYSSSMKPQTGVLPELEEINWPEGEWIFDAEVMAEDEEYVTTKERMQRKPPRDDVDALDVLPHTMNFWVFDCIVADGKDLSRRPFEVRMDYVFEHLPADPLVVPVHAFEDVSQARKQAQEHGYEGLILKKKDGEVEFGQRSSAWIKDKITEETVDLRVADFEVGSGKNAGKLGALKLETEDGEPMGNVGTGFTDRQREEIWENQSQWKGRVVEISFDAEAGYQDGLRFPAFEGPRDDKLQADSLQRLQNIIEQN